MANVNDWIAGSWLAEHLTHLPSAVTAAMMEDIDAIYEAEDTSEDGTMPLATEPLDPTSTTDFPPQSRRHLPLSRTSTASSTLSAIIAKNSAASTKSSFPANIARVSLTTRTAYSERSKGINGNSTAGHSAARAGVNSMKHTSNRCLKRRSGKITDRDRSKCKHHTLYELTATTRAAIPGSLISPLVCWDRSWVSWVIVLSVARRRAPNARKQHTLEALHAKTYGNRLSKKIFRTSTVAVKTRKSAPLVRNGPQVANGHARMRNAGLNFASGAEDSSIRGLDCLTVKNWLDVANIKCGVASKACKCG